MRNSTFSLLLIAFLFQLPNMSYADHKDEDETEVDCSIQLVGMQIRILDAKIKAQKVVIEAAKAQLSKAWSWEAARTKQAKTWYQTSKASLAKAKADFEAAIKAGKDTTEAADYYKRWKDHFRYVDYESSEVIEELVEFGEEAKELVDDEKKQLAYLIKRRDKYINKLAALHPKPVVAKK